MKVVINNAHYRVTTEYRLDAVGGGNYGGDVVVILKKRTRQVIEIPRPVWEKIKQEVTF